MAAISRESILLISALLKGLIYAILENISHDKALSKPYLSIAYVSFKNFGHFVIIEKGISFLLDAGQFQSV